MSTLPRAVLAIMTLSLATPATAETPTFAWRSGSAPAAADRLVERFTPPAGFVRASVPPGSFAGWLRALPMKPNDAPVLLHTGQPKPRQDVHAGVVDIDVGARDLQQCADAVMRLRAEWLYAAKRDRDIAFNDTGAAQPMRYTRWVEGERPKPQGRALVWSKTATPDASYASFRRYMDTVFIWAGTHSLERELVAVAGNDVAAGDVFIKGGFPGHAVLVVDVAESRAGEKRFLLAQSFMPAQNIHILREPGATDGSAWYGLPAAGQPLVTPEWTFPPGSLKRWR